MLSVKQQRDATDSPTPPRFLLATVHAKVNVVASLDQNWVVGAVLFVKNRGNVGVCAVWPLPCACVGRQCNAVCGWRQRARMAAAFAACAVCALCCSVAGCGCVAASASRPRSCTSGFPLVVYDGGAAGASDFAISADSDFTAAAVESTFELSGSGVLIPLQMYAIETICVKNKTRRRLPVQQQSRCINANAAGCQTTFKRIARSSRTFRADKNRKISMCVHISTSKLRRDERCLHKSFRT